MEVKRKFYSIEILHLDVDEEEEISEWKNRPVGEQDALKKSESTSSANLNIQSSKRKKNPANSDCEVGHCKICGSIFHWASKFQDSYPYEASEKPEEAHITLLEYSSHDLRDEKMKDFVTETSRSAVLET